MATFNGERFALCGKTIESLRRNVVLNLRDWVPPELTIVERRSENKLIISDGLGRENTYFLFGGRDESSYMLIQAYPGPGPCWMRWCSCPVLRGTGPCPVLHQGEQDMVQLQPGRPRTLVL